MALPDLGQRLIIPQHAGPVITSMLGKEEHFTPPILKHYFLDVGKIE